MNKEPRWKALLKAERERLARERSEYLEMKAEEDREARRDHWLHDAYDRENDR